MDVWHAPRMTTEELDFVLQQHKVAFEDLYRSKGINEALWRQMLVQFPKDRVISSIALIKNRRWDEISQPYGLGQHVEVISEWCFKKDQEAAVKSQSALQRQHYMQADQWDCEICKDSGYRMIHKPGQMFRILVKHNPSGFPPSVIERNPFKPDEFKLLESCSLFCDCRSGKKRLSIQTSSQSLPMFGDQYWHLDYEACLTEEQFFTKVDTHLMNNNKPSNHNSVLEAYTEGITQ